MVDTHHRPVKDNHNILRHQAKKTTAIVHITNVILQITLPSPLSPHMTLTTPNRSPMDILQILAATKQILTDILRQDLTKMTVATRNKIILEVDNST